MSDGDHPFAARAGRPSGFRLLVGHPYRGSVSSLGRHLREARLRAGLSQGDLARVIGVHPTYVSHVERGKRSLGVDVLGRAAAALDVTPEFLLDGERALAYRAVDDAIAAARQLSRSGSPLAAAELLSEVDVTQVDLDTAAEVGLAHAEALDVAGELEASVEVLEGVFATVAGARRYQLAARAAMRVVMALTESAELQRAVVRGEELLAMLPSSVAGTDEVVRLESTLLWAHIARGDATYARFRGQLLLERTRLQGSDRAVSSVHWNLAFVDEALGDVPSALGQLDAAIALTQVDDVNRDLPRLRLDRAFLLVSDDPPRPHEALGELDVAQAALEVDESSVELARASSVRSRASLQLGDAHAAQRHARRALELLGDGVRRDAVAAHEVLGDALLALGARPEARAEFRRAADLMDMIVSGRHAATLWRRIGDRLRLAQDQDERVIEAYTRALTAAGVRGFVPSGRWY